MITDEELAEMRERVRICHETCTVYSSGAAVRDVPKLLDEIDRLKAELAEAKPFQERYERTQKMLRMGL